MGPRQRGKSETEALVAVSCEICSQTTDEILLIAFKCPELLKRRRPHLVDCNDRPCVHFFNAPDITYKDMRTSV